MGMSIKFTLSNDDLNHFQEIMERVRSSAEKLDETTIIERSKALIREVRDSKAADFIRDRVNRLETLIAMALDEGWGLDEEDRERVVRALSYFAEAEDLIPDNIPGLGFLDDAIMIELVTREMEHEINAYRDFLVFRAAEAHRLGSDAADGLDREAWLEERRKQLHSRMRRRRRRGGGGGKGGRGAFSLLAKA